MPEHRGRKHHQDRVAETLREEIGAMIEGELVRSAHQSLLCHRGGAEFRRQVGAGLRGDR